MADGHKEAEKKKTFETKMWVTHIFVLKKIIQNIILEVEKLHLGKFRKVGDESIRNTPIDVYVCVN